MTTLFNRIFMDAIPILRHWVTKPGLFAIPTLSTLLLLASIMLLAPVSYADSNTAQDGNWMAKIQADIAAREYYPSFNDKGLQAANRAHNLRFYFNEGVQVHDRSQEDEPLLLGMGLAAYGRGEQQQAIHYTKPTYQDNEVSYQHPQLREWYRNSAKGLEQGFDLPARPFGADGELWLDIQLQGEVKAKQNGANIQLQTQTGRTLSFAQLHADDATGKRLPSRMIVLDENRVRLWVNDRQAVYPIVIDPTLTGFGAADATVMLEGNQVNAFFSTSVASAGDVNGDGYADVIVGADTYDNGQFGGVTFVYHGSEHGLSTTPSTTLKVNQAFDNFGNSVASAGDVNGDGYADVIVGASGYENDQLGEGAAFVYHGSKQGLLTTPNTTLEGNQNSAYFGKSVASAGDVNGDGYADVIVGAYYYKNDQKREGAAFVYHGSEQGLLTTPSTILEADQAYASFGISVASAGDVNNDGYADVIVGAYQYNNSQSDDGAAFVYHGSEHGLSTTPNTTLKVNQVYANFGISVASAGDVNGDSYADVIVGAYKYDNGQSQEGAAFVYHGSKHGLLTTPNTTLEANQADADFGISVASAGDVNGDGYADVIVGAHYYENGQTDEGAAFMYHGSEQGLSITPSTTLEANQASTKLGNSVASAGDVNGDGYADVIIGAKYYENDQKNEGAAFVYHGSEQGLLAMPSSTILEEANQAYAGFGISVASAGDVNQDGYADVIVGAYKYDNGQKNEGAAFVYHGSEQGLSTTLSTTLEANQDSAEFGISVASAGDVNNDGYTDIIVGADKYGQYEEGAAFVYHGSEQGLSTTPSTTLETNQADASFGISVASAGDVNQDGYADVIVGAYEYGQYEEGGAFVYHGSEQGLSTTPSTTLTLETNDSWAQFGISVASAGDVNQDGYADVIVGADNYMNDGGAFVYHGSEQGLSTTPSATLEADQKMANFGYSVASAGDVNGDSYADVIVGAYLYNNEQSWEGAAFMYHGSEQGLSTTPNTTLEANQAYARFGKSVASAGDVNKDGYADVIVGAYRYKNGQSDEGAAFVYHGSASGLLTTPNTTLEANQANAFFGISVASAGDVNNDGYADVIVGAYEYDNGQSNEGTTFVYLGTSRGINVPPIFTTTGITSINEDNLYNYNISISDNDNINLAITTPTRPTWLSLMDKGDGTATLTGTPTNDDVGDHLIILRVTDGTVMVDQIFTLTVNNVNDVPIFTSSEITMVTEDSPYNYPITTEDIDTGDTLTITAPTKPTWLSFTDNGNRTASLSGTPTNNDVGEHNVTLRVNDGTVDVDQFFTITVLNINDAPTADDISFSTNEDTDLNNTLLGSEVDDGDSLTYGIVNPPSDGTVSITPGTNSFIYNPNPNFNGTDSFSYKVNDEKMDSNIAIVTIEVTAVNDEPTFTSIPITAINEDTTYTYNIVVADPDVQSNSDIITITAPTKPTWLTLTDNGDSTATLTGIPRDADNGEHEVILEASDGVSSPISQQTFTIKVNDIAEKLTGLYLETSAATILNDGVIDIVGKLSVFPATGEDLSGYDIVLTITAPDGTTKRTQTATTHTDTGQFEIKDLSLSTLFAGKMQEGAFGFQVTFAATAALAESESPTEAVLVGASAGYAILVQGKIQNEEGLAAHNKTIHRIYKKFKERGFDDDNIKYFNYDTNQDGVDGLPIKSDISAAFTELQSRINSNPAPFYVVMIDHGGIDGTFHIYNGNNDDNDIITPIDLDGWLDTLESGLSETALEKNRLVMLGACYSGSFIPEVSQAGRIIITSATAQEESYKGPEEPDGIRSGEFFMEEFFTRLGKGDNIRQAFEFATEKTEAFTRKGGDANTANRFYDEATQHPLLDDNGDKKGSNSLSTNSDGQQAKKVLLGIGLNYDTNSAENPAEILSVSNTIYLSATESVATLQAKVNNANSVSSAPVDIRKPAVILNSGGKEKSEQLEITNLPRRFMNCSSTTQSCTTYFDEFNKKGKYEAFYFVRDNETNDISPIKRSVIYKNYANNPAPDAFDLVEPLDKSEHKTTLLFKWEPSTDLDGPVTYHFIIAKDSGFREVVYQQEELEIAMTYVDDTVALKDQITYYWKVEAVDPYGERTSSGSVFSLTTNNTNAPPGIGSLHISSALDFRAINGATILLVDEKGNPLPDPNIYQDRGNYNMLLPRGRRRAKIRVAGYEDQEIDLETSQGTTRLNVELIPVGGIPDQTGELQFTASTVSLNKNIGIATILVERVKGSDTKVTVDYAMTDGSAIAGSDYSSDTLSGTLTWQDKDERAKAINLSIIPDPNYEGDKTFTITLSNPRGGTDKYPAKLGAPTQITVTIGLNDEGGNADDTEVNDGGANDDTGVNDDGEKNDEPKLSPTQTVQFSSKSYTANEGNKESITLTVTRTGNGEGAVSVEYMAMPDGTAFANIDYSGDSFGTLTWGYGDSEPKLITLNLIDDEKIESPETAHLMLFPTDDIALGTPSKTILTIMDNDRAPLSLGQGMGISTDGTLHEAVDLKKFFDTRVLFWGGAKVKGQDYTTTLFSQPAQGIKILGEIHVDPKHVGQTADILVVASMADAVSEVTPLFLMLDNYQQRHIWDGDMTALVGIEENIILPKTQVIEIFQSFLEPVRSQIYFGYRLQEDGVIYFNGEQPIKVWVEEEHQYSLDDYNTIFFADVSRNGKLLVTASKDGIARLWDMNTGSRLALLRGHTDTVKMAMFSPNGRQILTASADNTARLWDVATRQKLLIFQGHRGKIEHATFSPNGQRLITTSADKTARLWNANNGKTLFILAGHEQGVQHAAFSHDGYRVVTTSWDHSARLWDAATTGEEIAVLAGHEDMVEHAAFSPDDQYIVTTSWDKTARLWDAHTGQETLVLKGHRNGVAYAAFSPDGEYIVTTSWDNSVRLWDAKTGEPVWVREHQAGVHHAAFSPNGQMIVTGSNDHTVRLWETTTGQPLKTLQGHEGNVWHVGFSPDGERVFSASWDNSVRVWEVESGEVVMVLRD